MFVALKNKNTRQRKKDAINKNPPPDSKLLSPLSPKSKFNLKYLSSAHFTFSVQIYNENFPEEEIHIHPYCGNTYFAEKRKSQF